MTEYKFIELITEVQQNESGTVGLMDFKRAEEILKRVAGEGWRVHTLFPDPHGTCLIQRGADEEQRDLLKSINLQVMCLNSKKYWWQFWK